MITQHAYHLFVDPFYSCPYSKVLPCLHILVMDSHTNTHTCLSCSCPELTDLNTVACSFLLLFYSFIFSVAFLKTILLGSTNKERLFLSVVTSLMPLCFLTFPIVFLNIELFIGLKKSYSKSFLVFVPSFVLLSMYSLSHSF